MSRYSTFHGIAAKDPKEESEAYAAAPSRVGHRDQDSVGKSTV